MNKRLILIVIAVLAMFMLCADVYTVSGIGREGDPFVFIDGKITFVTNLTPEEAPEGSKIEIYALTERQNVNFAEGRLVEEKKTEAAQLKDDVYTVSGIGREGDPFVFIDGKITFVTNLSPEKAPEGTKITIYDLRERETVNFARGRLAEEKVDRKIPDNVYKVAGIGREGDPFVRINDKMTFVTNLSPEQAPQGTLVEVYDLRERETVNFAQGRIYTPPKEKEEKESDVKEVEAKDLSEGDAVEMKISMLSAEGTGMGFYGRYLVYVPGTDVGETVNVRIDSIDDNLARGSRID